MLIKKNKRNLDYTSATWKVFDYPMPDKEAGVSVQEINGRAPEKGAYRNRICSEYIYVLKGSGMMCIETEAYPISEGDLVFIEAGEASYVEGVGLELLAFTVPDWTKEQCEYIENW